MTQRWGIQCYRNVKFSLILFCPLGQLAIRMRERVCTPMCGVWVGFDVGTWIVRHLFPSGANFRSLCSPPPDSPPRCTCYMLTEMRKCLCAFRRGCTPVGSRNAFPYACAPVPKYILSPLQKFLSVFSGLYAWS